MSKSQVSLGIEQNRKEDREDPSFPSLRISCFILCRVNDVGVERKTERSDIQWVKVRYSLDMAATAKWLKEDALTWG